MNLKELYDKISCDLEEEAIKKFEFKEDYIKWNKEIYEKYRY